MYVAMSLAPHWSETFDSPRDAEIAAEPGAPAPAAVAIVLQEGRRRRRVLPMLRAAVTATAEAAFFAGVCGLMAAGALLFR